MLKSLYSLSFLLCLLLLYLPQNHDRQSKPSQQLGKFPKELFGRPLIKLELSAQDQRFAQNFPGKIGRFTDGEFRYIIRLCNNATRRVHSASECLKAQNNDIKHLPHVKVRHLIWSEFEAIKNNQTKTIREIILDSQGQSWPDVSSWYWQALFRRAKAPYLIISRID